MSATSHSIWLVPEPAAAQDLSAAINSLSSAHDCPVFAPHITLLGDLHHDPRQTSNLCRTLFATTNPIDAVIQGPVRTEKYFMSLFLDATLSTDLTAIRRTIFQTFSNREPTEFRPHISLAYGLPQTTALNAEMLKLLDYFTTKRLVFNRLAIVKSAKSVPIAEWRTLSEIRLSKV